MENIVIVALIGVGLGHTVARMAGPFGVLVVMRTWVENRADAPAWLREGLGCPVCVAFWVTLATTIAIGEGWLVWLAGYGMAVAVLLWVDRGW